MNRIPLAVSLLCLAGAPAGAAPDPRPNVVLILADDLGYNALGCYGSPFVETPHLDRLAGGGQRWTRAYAGAPTCAPSRSVLLTGTYTPRTGVYRVMDRHLDHVDRIRFRVPALVPDLALDRVTLAEAFRAAGYRTGHFGKWHLGMGPHHPRHQGFDVAIESHGAHVNFRTDPPPDAPLPPDTYLGDYLVDRAIAFLDSCREAGRPFFLYLPQFLVHKPLEAKQALEAHYRDKLGGRYPPEVATVAAMTHALDESVGVLVAYLEAAGLLDDTLVLFTSDNGGYQAHDTDPNLWNRPLRGYKGQLYEGGVRVPAIFHWPGRIAAGSTCDEVLHFVDVYPTLLALAGLAVPDGVQLDGTSLHRVVLGEVPALPGRSVYWFYPKYAGYNQRTGAWREEWRNAVVHGPHKLVEYVETGRVELFDLDADPGETTDVGPERPDLLRDMRDRLETGKRRFGAPVPEPNPDYRGPG